VLLVKFLHWLIVATLASGQGSYLADIGPAPAVDLMDSEARPFSLASLKGKAVLVSFVYTTCNGTCPMTTARLDRVRRALQDEGLWGRSVAFVSITLDPARDTPEILARYARAYRADPKSWYFLTGPPDRVAKVIAEWDMWARVDPSGVIDHPSRVFLIDPSGHRREIYNLETLTPGAVVQDVRTVLGGGTATR
jgi:protein SCO1/2